MKGFWEDETYRLLEDTAGVVEGWSLQAARQGRYNDAAWLALASQALRDFVEEDFEEAIDEVGERNYIREQESLMEGGGDDSAHRMEQARRLKR